MSHEIHRKTPDELLRELQSEESPSKGRLKIFLGYASGVGKSFKMLDEARRRRERGQDVVVAAVQPRVSPEVQTLLDKLEVMPLQRLRDGEAMDIDAILLRRPSVCVIDGLAFNNPEGLRNRTRWQDARQLVEAGIRVIASINIQYVEELRDQVEAITGKRVTETVPTSFIRSADEIEIVDAPPEEPIERSSEDQMNSAGRQERFSTLREMTLVLAADVVDHQLYEYLQNHGIMQRFGAQERILVCITPRANTGEMLQTAREVAERFHGELLVGYVRQPELSESDKAALEERLADAREAGAQITILEGEDPVDAIIDFARRRGVTQLFIGHTQVRRRWFSSDPVERLVRDARGIDVRIFPQ